MRGRIQRYKYGDMSIVVYNPVNTIGAKIEIKLSKLEDIHIISHWFFSLTLLEMSDPKVAKQSEIPSTAKKYTQVNITILGANPIRKNETAIASIPISKLILSLNLFTINLILTAWWKIRNDPVNVR